MPKPKPFHGKNRRRSRPEHARSARAAGAVTAAEDPAALADAGEVADEAGGGADESGIANAAAAPETLPIEPYSLDDRRPTVMLRERAVVRVRSGALWVQNHDVERKVGYKPPPAGRLVNFVTPGGEFVAAGFFHPVSRVAGRVLSRSAGLSTDRAFFASRLKSALNLRTGLRALHPTEGYRWVNAEGDGLPGLIVDVYGDWLSVQINCAGFEAQRELLFDLLVELAHPKGIVERRESGQRRSEGLPVGPAQVVRGALPSGPPAPHWIREGALQMPVDLLTGQKTGLYLDQRDNRRRVGEYVKAQGYRQVADLYCYNGGFGLAAKAGGAEHVVFVDRSENALQAARLAWERNGFAAGEGEFAVSSVEEYLNAAVSAGKSAAPDWDLAIIDPPKLTQGSIHAHRALQFHRRINALALQRIRAGGMLVTCDCSGAVSAQDFQDTLAAAGNDAGVRLRLLEVAGGSADHPAPPGFRMGLYLKTLFLEVQRS